MKSRPIPFSAPMVRALLDGRKTQARRIAKLPEQRTRSGQWDSIELGGDGVRDQLGNPVTDPTPALAHSVTGACVGTPYATGDELWVRETWWRGRVRIDHMRGEEKTLYRADGEWLELRDGFHVERWRPSIHMPRWASRITLRVASVRVERLQAISEADAIAEGVEADDISKVGLPCYSARQNFERLWESIHDPDSWATNPWVWVVSFEVVP